ncbi:endonuclease/exonuclease/phosphatase [Massilia sp. WF1]|uniref:ExeM/NucH family extracellular endonuclease n=1 Tax=unclassified Massilia TaxID=2609279 RepID=UPI00064A23F8|nr:MULTISPECIES: ExeM/NucH family extracellular endonuclease [unclassified Massilia]ALK96351.1 endonuclease/exonuclease/phosphatase [Massilia sp. WG5]KLU37665.1 endonuclease/exonuclease/phosphatase [Massilia sp. WF1]
MTHRDSHSIPVRLTVLAALMAGLCAPALAADTGTAVVISQLYGGGGNTGATHKNDFIELFNRSNAAVDLGSWSVQYASATGTSWQVTRLTGVIQPGQYYLVQEAAGSGAGADMPQADASGSISMSATNGKVALVSSQTALSGSSPTSTTLVDLVGFGTANGFEGSAPTAVLSNGTGAVRKESGCTDNNDNAGDFTVGTVSPRTSASPLHSCSGAPIAQPIVLNCPASIAGKAGAAFSGLLQASDQDSIVDSARITSGAIAGIDLTGFAAAGGVGASASVSLSVDAGVASGNYPVVVTFGNGDGQSASCTVNVAVAGERSIAQIQGSGATSPYAGTVQTTTGVITKKLGNGFYIQDPDGDNDPSTPEAIYVFGASTSANVGDLVRVTGTVTEYTPSGAPRSFTELTNVGNVTGLGAGRAVQVTNIVLGAEDLRRYEGMLVRFGGTLTVNGNAYLGDRGELVLGNGRLETPTNRYRAGSPEAIALAAANRQNMVVLDDNGFTTPAHIPYLFQDSTVRAGDSVNDLVGVLDFGAIGGSSGWYKLQPTEEPVFSRTNPREEAPTVAPGNVRVASANVLNFFTTFTNGTDAWGRSGRGCTIGSSTSAGNCRGADNMTEFVRQRDKIVAELKAMDADAVGLMEIENNGDTTVSYLVDALNAATAPGTYAYVPKPPATGTDAIRVAMIYKPAVLTPIGGALSDGDAINNRPPMAQVFKANANGARFSLIVNHLKSKGSCGGGAGNTDSGDGQGCWNATRIQQAQRLATYFIPAVVQAAGGDTDVLAVGDFNSYGHEDPIAYLTSETGPNLVNELERFVRPNGIPYSYQFDGMSGYLDHALASQSLNAQVAGVTEWHNNADEPDAIDYNLGDTADDPYVKNAFRASDHDPVVVSLNLAPAFADVSGSVKATLSALTLNRITGKSTGSVSFTNTSGATISGPLQAVLEGLPAAVTVDNKSGSFAGSPYITLPATSLAPGATVTVSATFSNPNKLNITFTPKLYTGTF